MFSQRIDWQLEPNDLARALAERRLRGAPVLDLTESNPTRCGFAYPEDRILRSLSSQSCLVYDPHPRGMRSAREAVARYYREKGSPASADRLVLTASTSESYGFLFKLLCEPGDQVHVPRPSYPLFSFLTSLEGVKAIGYRLLYDGSWRLDFSSLESSLTARSRAVVAVHPNNPTGSYLAADQREQLVAFCESRGLPLIADEVFVDFPLREGLVWESFAGATRGLVFVLGGLSKLAGLPQMKLGWILAAGTVPLVEEALLRLEHIADTYLSVGTPVQVAAAELLELAPEMVRLLSERTRRNLASISEAAGGESPLTLLSPEAGWYAVLRLPAIQSSEEWALELLEKESVYLHPGSFFGLEPVSVVSSLLVPEPSYREGLGRILRRVGNRLHSSNG